MFKERGEKISNNANPGDCFIDRTTLQQVERFKYLRTVLSWNGSLTVEFEGRLRKANQALNKLKTV